MRTQIRCFIGDTDSAKVVLAIIRHLPDTFDVSLICDLDGKGYQVCSRSKTGAFVIRANQHDLIKKYVDGADLVICTLSAVENSLEREAFKFACQAKKPLAILSPNVHNMNKPGWDKISYHCGINSDKIAFFALNEAHALNIKNRWSKIKHIYPLGQPLFDEAIKDSVDWSYQRYSYREFFTRERIIISSLGLARTENIEDQVFQTLNAIEIISKFENSEFVLNEAPDEIETRIANQCVIFRVDYSFNIYLRDSDIYKLSDIVIASSDDSTAQLIALGQLKPVVIYAIGESTEKWLKDELKIDNPKQLPDIQQGRALLARNKKELEACIKKALKPMTQKNLLKNHKSYPNSAEKIAVAITALTQLTGS